MSTKRAKLTAGKARERMAGLEESIAARQQRLDQLVARLERSESPDERLLTAKERLERRLTLEREQLEKLSNLLERNTGQPEESGEFFGVEEIDELHRSFEEVRQNLAQMQSRIESHELPRDLGNRLAAFEERIVRREEVDSELFTQVLSLQTALDQERQTVRRLSRRIREQDQSLDALREAVEDSVMATVDMAERLDELEEAINEHPDRKVTVPSPQDSPHEPPAPDRSGEIDVLKELVEDARRDLVSLRQQVVDSLARAAAEREELRQGQKVFSAPAARPESDGPPPSAQSPSPPAQAPIPNDVLTALLVRLEALESSAQGRASGEQSRPDELVASGPKPASFARNGARGRQVAVFGVRPNQNA